MKEKIALIGMLVAACALAVACGPGVPARTAWVPPAKVAAADWDELFAQAVSLDCRELVSGSILVERQQLLDVKGAGSPERAGEDMVVDVRSLLLRMPDGRTLLVDTGLSKAFGASRRGSLQGLLVDTIIRDIRQQPGHTVGEALADGAARVDGVLLSHLHFDHVNGMRDLPGGLPVYCGKGETIQNYPLLFTDDAMDRVASLREISFDGAAELPILGPVVDLFGDRTVFAVGSPGHSVGSVSYLFRDRGGMVLFVGDAATAEGIAQGIGPGGFSADVKRAGETMLGLREFIRRYPQVRVVYSHGSLRA